jgi:hypothetical protein
MGPVMAAMAFASVMGFEQGGVVPGVETGDVVPAKLTPGEGVLPKPIMDNLSRASNLGGGPGGDTHVHVTMTNHMSALDADGMEGVLNKHADVVERHMSNALRKSGR